MRQRLLFARLSVIAFLFFMLPAPAAAEEAKPLPRANWPRSRSIDVMHIALDLRFDWRKKQAYGTAAITLSPFQSAKEIALDAGRLTIHDIYLANKTPLKFRYDGGDKDDGLAIALDREYSAGEKITIVIHYRTNWVNATDPNSLGGSNGKGIRFSSPTANDPNKPREIWSIGEPQSNRYWFPGYDALNDFRTSEFTATVEKGMTVISNGVLVDTRDNADGTRSHHWKMDVPHANYQTGFVIGEYVDSRQNVGGLALHNFGYPKETAAVVASVDRLPDMLRFFTELTGAKYPYPSYAQAFVQDAPWGVAGAGLATQSENMIDDDRTHADFLYLWDGLEAETLAHQWFGGLVTARDWSQVWLQRGFAHYFDGLFNEYKNGHAEFLLWNMLGDQTTYLADWNGGTRHPIVTRHYDDVTTFTSDNYSYSRGALVLHMLRKHLGEQAWKRAIRQYVKANAGRSVTTEDFRRAIEEITGQAMDWFFEQWLYKMGHPVFEVSQQYDDAKKQLLLRVRQTQRADSANPYPQVAFFEGKMDIAIDERIETVWIEPKAETVLSFSVGQKPRLVNFDYESTWIKELRFEKSLDDLLYQLLHDRDVLGKNWAMGELATLAKNEKTPTTDKARIYDGFRNLIGRRDVYWRVRFNALGQLQSLLAPGTEARAFALDDATRELLLTIIREEGAWLRFRAINFLGQTRDTKYEELYLRYLDDPSDRVIYAAAAALGKSKSPKAFDALLRLPAKPSWKNQSLISALNGLKELGDPRGFDLAFRSLSDLKLLRWRLPTSLWDFRIAAVEAIVAMEKCDAAYPLVFERFQQSMRDNDSDGVFNNVLLLATLADPRAQQAFDMLKAKYKDDANAMNAVTQYETQFKDAVKKRESARAR